MSLKSPHSTTRPGSDSSYDAPALAGLLGLLALIAGLIVAVSYPLAMATAGVGAVVALKLARVALSAFVRDPRGRGRELTVPGVATVEVRVTPE